MSAYLAFHKPAAWHFVGLELVFVTSLVLTLVHAVGRYRGGDQRPLFSWLTACCYGVFMELIAFNFLDNYTHARFTVQLYHDKLPLYVVCLYPVFLYTGLQIVARWRLTPVAEALLCGFVICLIDIPFDIAGVRAGWWVWSTTDKNLAVRWLGVPVTSFYWYLMFGAVYALLCRGLGRLVDKRPLGVKLLVAAPTGALVIVLGVLSFLPFHALKAVGVRDDVTVALHLAGCALLLAWVRLRGGAKPASLGALWPVPIMLFAFHLAVLVTVHPAPPSPLEISK